MKNWAAVEPINVDLFAGGGGATIGLERALGRPVDIAINHDWRAITMHEANHPKTRHYHTDVWEVDPVEACRGAPVDVLWASPDCTYYSKARGGKPFRDGRRANRRRALASVVVRWARAKHPRLILMENVEEFLHWGPLLDMRPDPARRGINFRRWKGQLEREGYRVEWAVMNAAHYGAATSRKRLFIVARNDGKPIVWPQPTHGPSTWRTAADIIDWSAPCPSIFTRKRPLAEATLRRIAHGVMKYVIESPKPFIVTLRGTQECHVSGSAKSVDAPLGTITSGGFHHALAIPTLINTRNGERKEKAGRPGQAPRVGDVSRPYPTITAKGSQGALALAYLARHWGGMTGCTVERPYPTITTKGCQDQLVEVKLAQEFDRAGEVRAFLMKYYSSGGQWSAADEPVHTIRTKGAMGLVTVAGAEYQITDIGMRMLSPRELFRAQGFPEDYDIAPLVNRSLSSAEVHPKRLNATDQVFLCGNSVPPQCAEALARANL